MTFRLLSVICESAGVLGSKLRVRDMNTLCAVDGVSVCVVVGGVQPSLMRPGRCCGSVHSRSRGATVGAVIP